MTRSGCNADAEQIPQRVPLRAGTRLATLSRVARPPHDDSFDASFALKRDPYRWISRRAHQLGSDVFEARLLLRPTLCLTGRDAAELFYDADLFQRAGAAPNAVQKTLFGVGGVQSLEGEAHLARKQLFLALTSDTQVSDLAALSVEGWRRAAGSWRNAGRVSLYAATRQLLTRAVCAWAGVPLPEQEVVSRTRDLTLLFDAAGSIGLRHLAARGARARCNRWAADVIAAIRAGELPEADGCPAQAVALQREAGGKLLLELPVAAVELLNLLRPTVAVAVYLVFVAHALAEHPEQREKLRAASQHELECFVQEVRRFYPFFPALPALVREDFEWRGLAFPVGTRALLDLYGTNHDARTWGDPERFRPERFRDRADDAFGFVPQGGGDVARGHRCPGEPIAIALMLRALRFLVDEIDYRVPAQDLRIDFARLPALPRGRMQICDVRVRS
jgi:fatty-acid peroxygenase